LIGVLVSRTKELVGPDYLKSWQKRWFDRLGALALAGGLSPVAAVGFIGSAIENRSLTDALFFQPRIGMGGETADTCKIRTIRKRITDGSSSQQIQGTTDTRATWFGQALRTSGIDEYPQLWQAVRRRHVGLIGVRPVMLAVEDDLREAHPDIFPEWKESLALATGITGLSQLGRRSKDFTVGEYRAEMKVDIVYKDTACLGLDMDILRRTPGVLLTSLAGRLGLAGATDAAEAQAPPTADTSPLPPM
jgi:lipopolysaccharide/colanic/teichoic acid biosynthesis glycosyltransferase